MHLGAQERLATAKARRDCSDGHPSLWRCAHGLFAPHIQIEAMAGEPAGEAKFAGIKFADPSTEHCATHRIYQVSCKQTVVLVAAVKGCREVEVLSVGRLEQALDPRGGEVRGFWRGYCAGLCPQQIRSR